MKPRSDQYCEFGGLRIGEDYWASFSYTWPFARISISTESTAIHVGVGPLFNQDLLFQKSDITEIHRKRGLFNSSIEIKHSLDSLPLYIRYIPWSYTALKNAFEERGYIINE